MGGLARLMAKLTWDGQVLTAVIKLRLQARLETHCRQSDLMGGWGLSVTSAENEPRRILLAGPLVCLGSMLASTVSGTLCATIISLAWPGSTVSLADLRLLKQNNFNAYFSMHLGG